MISRRNRAIRPDPRRGRACPASVLCFLLVPVSLLLATSAAVHASQSCVAVAGEQITAADLARAVPAFSTVPAETEIGYSPVPGVRRYFYFPELHNLALRFNVDLPTGAQACIQREMETLRPEHVIEAMRKALDDPQASIEILQLSRYPIPHGDVQFDRSTLPIGTTAPVVWRGSVLYAGGRKFGIWASVKLRVHGMRVVATQDLAAGKAVQAGQVKLEPCDVYPVTSGPAPSLDGIVGYVLRSPVSAGGGIVPAMVEAPKEVERGDVVQVEVHSGAALLKLEGKAESAGHHGEPIKIHSLVSGKSFSARITGKDRVVVTAGADSKSQDSNP